MCKKEKVRDALSALKKNSPIALSQNYRSDRAAVNTLTSRIGCTEEQLTDGSLTYQGMENGNVLVGRPIKANTVPVAFKFFELFKVEEPA